MHKRFVNHCTIEFTLSPCGPILIKSGKEGADPTKPQMEFVETYHQGGRSIYLPGSSLKGAIRAHAERIIRTVGSDRRPSDPNQLWASNPLDLNSYQYLDEVKDTRELYRLSSFTDQMFGSVSIASRARIEDAYPADKTQLKIEERNGVAIDRVFGSVAVGPFDYQVCTAGEFRTKIHLKNFTLAQLALIGLVLRDLDDGWFGLGFAKSRGMGLVEVSLDSVVVQYPGCVLENDHIKAIGLEQDPWPRNYLLGAGEFLTSDEAERYGFPHPDHQETPVAGTAMDLGFGVQLTWSGQEDIEKDLFTPAVKSWTSLLGVAA
ncbi:CRISPR-associated protein [Nodosilinea sp. LEGE 07088]|uniref:RAMP superfamily CRISPR-associated protein n=1 Tax=Nodosilinea sp. LEGE 07088 TaxID=2777968 RepID=UPI001881A529|nr:RAMP superfamily CRISPR-associated protein [Nodosilinea sp. LEGE 07088]MBE9138829.1 CRISPR-associated protein [Nodosilinea sp. LEGE 07088]